MREPDAEDRNYDGENAAASRQITGFAVVSGDIAAKARSLTERRGFYYRMGFAAGQRHV
jgi:hypothetical protein